MKQILLSSILLISCATLSAQSISIKKVGDITPVAQPTEVLPAYDTTSLRLNLENIVKNPHYYDGQKILFLPLVENEDGRLFDYYSRFFLENEVACPEIADTIWIRRRKVVKPGDFKLDIPTTNIYHPQRVTNGKIRLDNEVLEWSGLYTPASEIEGKWFTIISSEVEKDHQLGYNITFSLLDDNSQPLLWKLQQVSGTYGYPKVPVIIYAAYNLYSTYPGQTFVALKSMGTRCVILPVGSTDNKFIETQGDIKCEEYSFMDGSTYAESIYTDARHFYQKYVKYYEPTLLFKDSQGQPFIIRASAEKLSFIDSHPNHNDVKGGVWGNSYKSVEISDLMEKSAYEAKVEAERIARAEESKAIKEEYDKRVADLTKRFGAADAKDILAGYVKIGWDKERCIESWGYPDKINKDTGAWGVHEQWVYRSGSYLYFDNGKLSAIQN